MSSTTESGDRRAELWSFFIVTWAVAVLFHVWGNARLAPEWGRALLVAAALAVLARPRSAWLSLPLVGAVLANVWLEAPTLGNHWLLHGFLALVVALSVLAARGEPGPSIERVVPPARLLLLAFYSFAAFAKLNEDFFDPDASCAVFYLRESADSWGALELVDGLSSSAEVGVALVVAGTELLIPLLLYLRRTRHVGVVVALCFHYVLAIDRTHQFFDFSAVLAVFFLLFLDPELRIGILDRIHDLGRRLQRRWSSGPELARLLLLGLVGVASVYAAGPDDWTDAPGQLRQIGVVVWLLAGAALIILVVGAVGAERRSHGLTARQSLTTADQPLWVLGLPLLAVLNGLTPYLEIKSGTGWNMYSNLAVVDGESNHLVVPSGLALTGGHERLVRVTDTTEPSLLFYDGDPWLIPEVQLRDFLADRPETVVEGRIGEEMVRYVGAEQSARSEWRQKFQVFRAVDGERPTGCQPSFGPAR